MTKRFKIEPDLTCPELAGYKLPPCSRGQEDDLLIEYPERPLGVQGIIDYQSGFLLGYNKAREKFEFSEEQLKQAFFSGFEMALDTFSSKSKSVVFHNYLKSLRTPRTPIEIEVEMDSTKSLLGVWTEFVPALNPDGTVKGMWVYE